MRRRQLADLESRLLFALSGGFDGGSYELADGGALIIPPPSDGELAGLDADHGSVDLSLKEFGVLEALLRAHPAYRIATDLLREVCDENADPYTKTVHVTIGRLLRKVGNPPVIETAPGVGYRIAEALT